MTAGAAAIFSAISSTVVVELVGGDDPRHDAVRERLLGAHRPAGEHHVGGDAVPAHLEQPADAAGVGDHAVARPRGA